MNKKIEELISGRKEELRSQTMERRRRHLIDLGLLSDKSTLQYFDTWQNLPDCKWDEEKKKYYVGVAVPLEVTDEEYAEICKYFPESEENGERQGFGAENTLNIMASVLLAVGVLGALVVLVLVISEGLPGIMLLCSVLPLVIGLSTWATLKCFVNISVTLKLINAKIK